MYSVLCYFMHTFLLPQSLIKAYKGDMDTNDLVSTGLYTAREAGRLLDVRAATIRRWLRGYESKGVRYAPLWTPQVDLNDGDVHLGFHDLMELRAAHQFLAAGVSAQAVRRAILVAKETIDEERPLSTTRFRTDGQTIFLQIAKEDSNKTLLDLFRRQYAFSEIMAQSLKDIEFEGITPRRWWPRSKDAGVVIDPNHSYGQPIEYETYIPTEILAQSAKVEGGIENAARAWMVEPRHIQRAVDFEESFERKAFERRAA